MILLAYAGILIILMLLEEKFIYFPIKYPAGEWDVEEIYAGRGQTIPKVEDCFFSATDGVRLHGWFCTPQRKTEQGMAPVPTEMTLLWFHGNAGNISHRYDMIRRLMPLPVSVFILDYRGYGKSKGEPSEQGIYLDARAAWDYLVQQRGLSAGRIALFGKSLGSAAAIELATQVDPAGLIVQSGFTSIPEMASAVLPFIPRHMVRTKMDSIGKVGRIRCPKLFIHSPTDEVVPYALGRRLYEAAAEPKRFYQVAGAPHNETYLVGGAAYLEALRSFLHSCAPNAPPNPTLPPSR